MKWFLVSDNSYDISRLANVIIKLAAAIANIAITKQLTICKKDNINNFFRSVPLIQISM